MITKEEKRFLTAHGFSLIEIITVLAILSVLSTIGVVVFSKVMDYRKQTEIKQKINVGFLRFVCRLQEDLDQLVSPTFTDGRIIGERRVEDKKRYQSVPLDDDWFSLPILYENGKGECSVVQVKYYIDRGLGAVPCLVRVLSTSKAENPDGAREIVLPGVWAMRIFYHDGNTWLDHWREVGYPKGIKVCLVLADENRVWEQSVREYTYWIKELL